MNNHIYGFRFKRSIHGAETPQIITLPIASAYAPNTTFGGGGTAVNLNIGDPVRLAEDGTLVLVEASAVTTGADTNDYTYGIVAGFPRINIGGFPRPNGFYVSGTTHAGLGADDCTLCSIIPVKDNIFEIDTDSAGGASIDSKAEFAALVGGSGNWLYTPLTSGAGQPKVNPLIDISTVTLGTTQVNQLRVVGLGKGFDQADPTLAFVPLQVVFNLVQGLEGTSNEMNE